MFDDRKLRLMEGVPPVKLKPGQQLTRAVIRQNTPIMRKQSPLIEALKYTEIYCSPLRELD